MTVNDSNFINNTATSEGGAIFNWDILTITGNTFISNSAKWGGAISSYGNADVNGSTFTNNTAISPEYGYGGAIHNDGTMAVNNSAFINNTATSKGGAIYNDGTMSIYFSRIIGNMAAGLNNDISSVSTYLKVDAKYNWWGSNSDPTSRVINAVITPWIILNLNANPTTINLNKTLTITADLLNDSNGTYHDPTSGHVPNGIPVNFTTTLGTINSPVSTVNGTAQSNLNSGSVDGVANVSVNVDSQTVQMPVFVSTSLTITQVKQAASNVKNYIETYHQLPSNVTINGTNVSISQFLELLTTALLQINNGTNNSITLRNFSAPTNPKDQINTGIIYKTEYLKIASDVKNYMDSSGKTPDYAYGTSIGNYLGFQNLVYMYSKIMDYYNTSGKMAGGASMEPWSIITSKPVADPNAPKFSVEQIKIAASNVRNYVETNYKLPDTVQIGSNNVSMPQFLELLTSALLQINTGNSNTIPLRNFSAPINPKEDIRTGNILKAEYLKLANDIKNYMDSNGKTPDYAYGTSLGTYLRYENLVYMYSMILDYYNTSGKMADWAAMKPWSTITSQMPFDPNATKFTVNQIKVAASNVRNYVETNHKLPNYVTIGTNQVNMSQFLELSTTALLQINSGNSNSIPLRNFSNPTSPKDNINTGNIYKTEYLKIASDIKNYMDSSGKTPDYAYGTSIGTYLGFQNLVYMYSMILDYYNTSSKMADWAAMKPWSMV